MRKLAICSLAMAMAACATKPVKEVPVDPTAAALNRSALDISSALLRLAEVEQYDRLKRMPNQVRPYMQVKDMAQVVSLPWDGPLEAAVRRLARESGYAVKAIGRVPVIPILVRIGEEPATVSDHLRSLGYQAGSRCDVVVDTARKVVTLEYRDAGL
ncbi:DotD/TraH family lipoprotein [Stenotrophomonas maltophilia]|uniref:DotD/TraH family lipoprotein n=1 Tax=Stenotrophomonas maltophilia TaxID=40324 RepID=UPI000B4C2642|nr:DotD/TraH family lipoprotein [Stenotrophomonas maltophilia]OWQ61373.1 type IV secretion protein DotD [Stenotrophomonas maltophilia]